MITAEEARKQAIEILKNRQIEEISKQIEAAINRGKFSITVNYVSEATKKELEDLGYSVDFYAGTYQEESSWDICW